MPISTDDLLHREGQSRGERIALAKLAGYSWEAIAAHWKISVDEAKEECHNFLANWIDEL